MASPNKIYLTVDDTGVVKNEPQNESTAILTSKLLQENHDKHHIYFNQSGFHNHIAHQLLTLYGLGAPASVIQKQYDANSTYQRPIVQTKTREIQDMGNPTRFKTYLGKQQYYRDFLMFFQAEMKAKGWQNVLNEYVFAGDERADDMLGRMYGGFLHPIIHLGFGVEFNQPAIIAEALAQAATHDTWTKDFLLNLETAAATRPPTVPKTLPELLDDINADKKLSTAADWNDSNKIRDGILTRASYEMSTYALAWAPTAENLDQKTVEMINASIYFTTCAQAPPKQVKFDFYYIHCLNSGIFFPTFNDQTWLSTENKVRLLKFKGWIDLTMYASRRSPELLLNEITSYVPMKPDAADAHWPGIFRRLWELEQDDGHAVKLGRAVRNGELKSKEWVENGGNEKDLRIKSDMWEKIGNMVVDSVEGPGEHWVRNAGFKEAWEEYGDRPERAQL